MDFVEAQAGAKKAITWKTLGVYAQALLDITRAPAAELKSASFIQVANSDHNDFPEAQAFIVPGGSLGYRRYGSPETRRIVVLIHGSGCFGDLMHAMASTIAERAVAQVYTLDMRGHGLSTGRRGHAVRHPHQMLGDIALFIAHLQSSFRHSSIALAGHSAGGGLVLAFGRSEYRHAVSSYIFLAPFLGLGSEVNRPHFGGWVRLKTIKLGLIAIANLFGIRRYNEGTVVEFATAAARDGRYVSSWSFNTLLAFGPGPWLPKSAALLSNKPVLVLALQNDECFFADAYSSAFRLIAPQASVPKLGTGGHWDLLVDADAIDHICSWLVHQRLKPAETRPINVDGSRAA